MRQKVGCLIGGCNLRKMWRTILRLLKSRFGGMEGQRYSTTRWTPLTEKELRLLNYVRLVSAPNIFLDNCILATNVENNPAKSIESPYLENGSVQGVKCSYAMYELREPQLLVDTRGHVFLQEEQFNALSNKLDYIISKMEALG